MANHKEKQEKYTEFESIKSGGQEIVKKVFKPENTKIIYARKQQNSKSEDEQKFLQLLIQQQQKQQQQTKLLKIYEQYEENKMYYTVQEYCKKGDIRVRRIIKVQTQKQPENILMSDDGNFKLCDFGSIKKLNQINLVVQLIHELDQILICPIIKLQQ